MLTVEPATWKPCPFCGSQDLDVQIAYWIAKAKSSEAALAERDKRIARIKNKLELVYCVLDEMKSQHEFCDCSDDPDNDICIGCRLTEILSDMRAEVPSET